MHGCPFIFLGSIVILSNTSDSMRPLLLLCRLEQRQSLDRPLPSGLALVAIAPIGGRHFTYIDVAARIDGELVRRDELAALAPGRALTQSRQQAPRGGTPAHGSRPSQAVSLNQRSVVRSSAPVASSSRSQFCVQFTSSGSLPERAIPIDSCVSGVARA